MTISFQKTVDLSHSAELTFTNMRAYYEHYNVDWAVSTIQEQISTLNNWDILYNGQVVGAIRLAFDENECYIRDLQVSKAFQNKGIGAVALKECERLALSFKLPQLKLRVFKISPARHLYERSGFVTEKEEDRFIYMIRQISS